ncbi:hypothetical protein [Streptomyces flaveolus]|uniref:hypothetical protein n=1 Tax=Streptomyces flaveolus TaxID=67297 RepID=UPI00333162AE
MADEVELGGDDVDGRDVVVLTVADHVTIAHHEITEVITGEAGTAFGITRSAA